MSSRCGESLEHFAAMANETPQRIRLGCRDKTARVTAVWLANSVELFDACGTEATRRQEKLQGVAPIDSERLESLEQAEKHLLAAGFGIEGASGRVGARPDTAAH